MGLGHIKREIEGIRESISSVMEKEGRLGLVIVCYREVRRGC